MTLREELFESADPRYREFSAALTPGAGAMIGVRLPLLRRIARRIARDDWRAFLDTAPTDYFEERMLHGMVIGYADCPVEERLERTARFIPMIDNWSVCDACCMRLRRPEREAVWQFIQPYFHSPEEFGVRYAVVTALANFVDEAHIDPLLRQLGGVRHEAYYARMGVAWAVSVCYVKFPERTAAWLADCPLDDWTYNKSLQKITESLRVSAADKAAVRAMKRRAK